LLSKTGGLVKNKPLSLEQARWRLHLNGVVQGVGFRPFVHGLASQLDLHGWVRNNNSGVVMELQGPESQLAVFRQRLNQDAPPLAHIMVGEMQSISLLENEPPGLAILASELEDKGAAQAGRTLISPDIALCPACRQELSDPADRRYRYPFTNCTHCGPRFTFITGLPYDRPRTTMADFALCPACAAEYNEPSDRRFHAQPVACPVCGPQLWYVPPAENGRAGSALETAVHQLQQGGIVAVKGLGGFHLACLADHKQAVHRLRQGKDRPHKPLAVMVSSMVPVASCRTCSLGCGECRQGDRHRRA
jgi:hydrogenase maturation protein HypF